MLRFLFIAFSGGLFVFSVNVFLPLGGILKKWQTIDENPNKEENTSSHNPKLSGAVSTSGKGVGRGCIGSFDAGEGCVFGSK